MSSADLEKYAEEKQGLAKPDPFVMMEQVIRVTETLTRTYRTVQRKSNYETYKALDGAFLDAHNEIEIMFMKDSGKVNMKTAKAMFGIVHGSMFEDPEAEYSDMEKAFKDWYSSLSRRKPIYLSMCLNVCGLGHSIKQAAEANELHRDTGRKYLRLGLDDYCIRRGWGSQLTNFGT